MEVVEVVVEEEEVVEVVRVEVVVDVSVVLEVVEVVVLEAAEVDPPPAVVVDSTAGSVAVEVVAACV